MKNEKIKILLVDDDTALLQSIQAFLKKKGFSVATAINGEKGLEYFKSNLVDIIISDIKMPKMNGIDLLNNVKRMNSNTKFIFISGFSEIMETKEAYERGAHDFLTKPFGVKDLLNSIESIYSVDTLDAKSMSGKEYFGIEIDKFIAGSKIEYPIYIRLSTQKFVKVAHTGEDINMDRIKQYKNKGIKKLYLEKEDYQNYIEMTKKIIDVMKKRTNVISTRKKTEFMKTANKLIMESIYAHELDKSSVNEAKEVVESTFSVIVKRDEIFRLISDISQDFNDLYSHSLAVSMFSTMLAKRIPEFTDRDVQKITTGALFHDCGKKVLPQRILNKKLVLLNSEEKAELEKHPTFGSQMLGELQDIDDEVIKITLEHHEDCLGKGYPFGKTESEIHPFSKVVAIADYFMVSVAQSDGFLNEQKRYEDSLSRMLKTKYKHFKGSYLDRFLTIFPFADKYSTKI